MLELTEGQTQVMDTLDTLPPTTMSERAQTGLVVLGFAAGLGILGDVLLRATPWGINAFLWIGALVATTVGVLKIRHVQALGEGRWMVIPVLLFSACIAWRESGTLFGLNVIAVCMALAIASFRTVRGRLWISGIAEYIWAGIVAVTNTMIAPLLVILRDIEWNRLPRGKWTPIITAIARGVAIAIPVLAVFGGLLMAADAVFENMVGNLFDFDLGDVISHVFLFGFWMWLTTAFLHQTVAGDDGTFTQFQRPSFARIGMIETGMVLGTLNLLFLAFVAVQFRYFFGGAEYLIQQTVGLTYAEYARRGFFELVTVAALLLPLLLGTHWLMGGTDQSKASRRLFTGMATFSVAMIFVMIVSGVMRMATYTQVFGLTELRVYTTAFMGWLAVVFGWFSLTVLRGQRRNFAVGAMVTGFLAIFILNVINPDALITATNIARGDAPTAIEGSLPRAGFDDRYITTLSADAVPTLVASLNSLPADNRCYVADQLLFQWTPPAEVDWRTWNWGRWQAWQTVGANLGAIEMLACS
jgi:hypothetical protein